MIITDLYKIDTRELTTMVNSLGVDTKIRAVKYVLTGDTDSGDTYSAIMCCRLPFIIDNKKISEALKGRYNPIYIGKILRGELVSEVAKMEIGEIMVLRELQVMAKALGLKTSRKNKMNLIKDVTDAVGFEIKLDNLTDSVRQYQIEEGNDPCFDNIGKCGNRKCCWYDACQGAF